MEGWIKTHRKLQEWEWYNNSNMVHLLIHLVLSANHKDGNWRGQVVKRGQLITGFKSLNSITGISIQSLRTCLERLKSTSEITIKATNKNSLITILNYDFYQSTELKEIDTNKQTTHDQQTINMQSTTNKNVKNVKNEKNDKETIPDYSDFLFYALENKPKVDQVLLKMKYESWKVNGWMTGGKTSTKIKNWKSTLLNTLPYIKDAEIKPKTRLNFSGPVI
jgi:hypothetical protein